MLASFEEQQFKLTYGKTILQVERLDIPKRMAFRVVFSSKREPIVVAVAKGVNDPWFWTSIPEGRQKEAEGVGRLIEDYLKTKQ